MAQQTFESTGTSVLQAKKTRRRFLDLVLGSAAAGWLATVLYPVLRYLTPLPQTGPSGPIRLTRNEMLALERNQFVILSTQGKRILVLRDNQQKYHAMSAKCTHEGCTVQFVPGESVIWCACHNGRFDLNGRVISGPPPKPLPQYVAEEDEEGLKIIVKETA